MFAGILCNPGAAYRDIGVTEAEVESLAGSKEGCDDEVDFIQVRICSGLYCARLTMRSGLELTGNGRRRQVQMDLRIQRRAHNSLYTCACLHAVSRRLFERHILRAMITRSRYS